MKKKLKKICRYIFAVSLPFFLIGMKCMAQDVPNANPSGSQINFVRTWEATTPQQNQDLFITGLVKDVKQTTQYLDGLGRVVQTVAKSGSLITSTNSPTDLVAPVIYDVNGRVQENFMPFSSTTNDGSFKTNTYLKQAGFMHAQFSSQGENYFYSKADYETSPLDRVLREHPQGNSWTGNGKGTETQYLNNTLADAVQEWNVDINGAYSTPAIYPAGQLYKTIKIDEHGFEVIEFKDNTGNVILKKVQQGGDANLPPITPYVGWLCTYYVYDDMNNLRLVIPPVAVNTLQGNGWNIYASSSIISEFCFYYSYDVRKRMTVKKVPGSGEVWMVYDARDRLVMTQDANLRLPVNNKWMVMLYDDLNRVVQTGLLLNTYNNFTFAQHLIAASTSTAYPFTILTAPPTTVWEYLTATGYDDYTKIPPLSGLTKAVDYTNINATYGFYTTVGTPDYAQLIPGSASAQIKGLVAWSQVKVIGSAASFEYSVSLYDEKPG